jgi:3-hydroxymyristoyl/3-hydroxydecanoyl-(acyl carrier protein) dehydratase
MAIETFLETSKLLYPYLHVVGIRDTEFLDILEIPQGMPRESTINCELVRSDPDMTICQLSLCTKELSPTGRIIDRFSDNYRSKVILSKNRQILNADPRFSIRPEELDSRPMDHEEVLQWYTSRTDMLGRYRIMEKLDGTSPSAVKGYTLYKDEDDFFGGKVVYQYSPYLLEALLQVVNFYIAMRDPDQEKSMIPFRIGEMLFTRKVSDGEFISLEARMTSRNEEGITWEARALDSDGMVIMLAKELIMRWFQK